MSERDPGETPTLPIECGRFELKALIRARLSQALYSLDASRLNGEHIRKNMEQADELLGFLEDMDRTPPPEEEIRF